MQNTTAKNKSGIAAQTGRKPGFPGPQSSMDPKRLARMVGSCIKAERMAAVEKLNGNVEALVFVAKHAYYDDVALAAVRMLSGNTKALKEIAKEPGYLKVGLAALGGLSDEKDVREVKEYTTRAEVRSAARAKLEKMGAEDTKFVTGLADILTLTQV